MAPYTYQQVRGYYYGLPSRPSFVASTINEVRVLPAVGEHKIVELWEAGFADQVIARLSAMKVDWARLDAVRIGIVGESSAPVILWIGVVPESLSGENGCTVAFDARKVLYNCGIKDVEVEIRESRVFKSVSPKLLAPPFSSNPLVTFVDPLSVALGLPICADGRWYAEGTGSFYVARSGVVDKVFLVTALHVISPLSLENNETIECKNPGQLRHKVILLGDAAYNHFITSIMDQIGRKVMIAEHQKARRQMMEGREGEDVEDERAEAKRLRDAVKKAIQSTDLTPFTRRSSQSGPTQRIASSVMLSLLLLSSSLSVPLDSLRTSLSSRSTRPRSTRATSAGM